MVYRRRPQDADLGGGNISSVAPDGTTPESLLDAIKTITSQNPYASSELRPFQWYQQWNEINPDIDKDYRPNRGRHVKQRVPDKAIYSFWYEITVAEINAQWFTGSSRVLVRSSNPFEMAVEVAMAWNARWPTSAIISEVAADKASVVAALYSTKGLQINMLTDDAPYCRHGYVNLVIAQVTNRSSVPPGTLFLQQGIGKEWPGVTARQGKSAGFTAQSKDLGLSRDVAENHTLIIDSYAHRVGPSSIDGLNCSEPLEVDVSPGVSSLLEDRYHNWQLARRRAFKALTLDEQVESVRQDKRQELFDQALHLYGTPFGDEVPELLASLDGKAVEAGDQWRQHVLVRQQAQADLVAVLP